VSVCGWGAAIDEPGQRFAVTDREKITVIQLG